MVLWLMAGKSKRDRGAAGKNNVLIAFESKDKQVDFIAMEVVGSICQKTLETGQKVRFDALPTLNIIDQAQNYEARVNPSYFGDEWLPWVHIAIGNL
jgi:hypothetical protein